MNPKTKVMEILLAEPEKFNEFIMCLFNRGLGDIEYDYCNDQNFYYQITKKTFNINNIFIFQMILAISKKHQRATQISI